MKRRHFCILLAFLNVNQLLAATGSVNIPSGLACEFISQTSILMVKGTPIKSSDTVRLGDNWQHPIFGRRQFSFLNQQSSIKVKGGVFYAIKQLLERRGPYSELLTFSQGFAVKIDSLNQEMAVVCDGVVLAYKNKKDFDSGATRIGLSFADMAGLFRSARIIINPPPVHYPIDFASEQLRIDHRKHHEEFGALSDEEYVQQARDFLATASPQKILLSIHPYNSSNLTRYALIDLEFSEVLVYTIDIRTNRFVLNTYFACDDAQDFLGILAATAGYRAS